MTLTNLNTNSNSELVDLLLKMLNASHHLQNKTQFQCPAFKVSHHLIPTYPFEVISYNFLQACSAQPNWNCQCSLHVDISFPSYVHTIHSAYMSLLISECLNHISAGTAGCLLKDPFSLSHLQHYIHSQCSIPKLSHAAEYSGKIKPHFQLQGWALVLLGQYANSFILTIEKEWIGIRGTPIKIDLRTSLKYWGSVSSSRARDAQVVSLRIYSCHPPTSQEKEQSW